MTFTGRTRPSNRHPDEKTEHCQHPRSPLMLPSSHPVCNNYPEIYQHTLDLSVFQRPLDAGRKYVQ